MVRNDREEVAAERDRRYLYREGATEADVVAYLDRKRDADHSTGDPTGMKQIPEQGRGRSRLRRRQCAWIGAVAAVVAILVVGGLRVASSPPDVRPSSGATTAIVVSRAPALARDDGPQRYAGGAAERVGEGSYRYTIASGDTAVGVAARFHVCAGDVNDALPAGVDNSVFPPGTVLAIALDRTHASADGSVDCR
jgi:hypothetical protein